MKNNLPARPYQYAAYKHNMTRNDQMLGEVLRKWRDEMHVSKATLAYVATRIAQDNGMPAKLTVADITNYEDGKWVKGHYEGGYIQGYYRNGKWVKGHPTKGRYVPGHYDPTKRCQPKADKLALLVAATGMTPEQLTGYNPYKTIGILYGLWNKSA